MRPASLKADQPASGGGVGGVAGLPGSVGSVGSSGCVGGSSCVGGGSEERCVGGRPSGSGMLTSGEVGGCAAGGFMAGGGSAVLVSAAAVRSGVGVVEEGWDWLECVGSAGWSGADAVDVPRLPSVT